MSVLIILAMSLLWAVSFYGFALIMNEEKRVWGIGILIFTSWGTVMLKYLSHWSYEALSLLGLTGLFVIGGSISGI